MSAVLSGLSASSSYLIGFYWAVRADHADSDTTAGNLTESSFSILVNGQVVYQSAAAVSDLGGWKYAETSQWQPTSVTGSQATVAFYVSSTSTEDHCILFDSVTVQLAGAITLPSLQDFESPSTTSTSNFQYTPTVTVHQPWTFETNGGGIGHTGGPWDPPQPSQPPSNQQYAFLQTSPGGSGNQTTWMNATLFNLTTGVTYQVSFYYATRFDASGNGESVGYQTQSQLTLLIGGQQIWQSPANITDQGGWTAVAPITFTGSGNLPIVFLVTSIGSFDHAVLVDAVRFTSSLPVPTYYLSSDVTYDFENPSLAFTDPYQYNPPLSSTQPFTWSIINLGGVIYGGGGVAAVGSPWDPPAPTTPPSGSQYGFLQTSPNNDPGLQLSNMTAAASLSAGYYYNITFYYAARAGGSPGEMGPDYDTQSTLTVLANGVQVWTSGPNLSDSGGWVYAVSASFAGVQGGGNTIQFIDQSSSNDDHTILIDSVTIVTVGVGAPSPSSSSAAPSASSSSAAASSSTAVTPLSSSAAAASSSATPSTAGTPSSSSTAAGAVSSSASTATLASSSATVTSSAAVAQSSSSAASPSSSSATTVAATSSPSSSTATVPTSVPTAASSSSAVTPAASSSTAPPVVGASSSSATALPTTPTAAPSSSSSGGAPSIANAAAPISGALVCAPVIVLVLSVLLLL